MSFDPIISAATVKEPPARAFIRFTNHTKDWWKKETPFVNESNWNFFIANTVGGRWFERDEDGAEITWGQVLAFQPPGRLLLAMQLDAQFRYDLEISTEIEIGFAPAPGGACLVTLAHRNLERLGASAQPMIEAMRAAWARHVEEFAEGAKA